MAPRQPKTKLDVLKSIKYELIERYFETHKAGLINPSEFNLKRFEKNILDSKESIKAFGDEGFIQYYSALGILYAAQGKSQLAKDSYKRAIDLNPADIGHYINYINILINNADFDQAEHEAVNYLRKTDSSFEALGALYQCGLRNLNFDLFRTMYEKVRFKDYFSTGSKKNLEGLYAFSEQLMPLASDLKSIGIDRKVYSEFFDILRRFHSEKLYQQLNFRFCINKLEEQYVSVDVNVDVSTSVALQLTSEIEDRLVKHAIETNNTEILSSFLVYYKSKDMVDQNISFEADIYLGANEDLMV
ncbi:tetratricopeptide repeat protein [Psychrobacter sanguinis]|uniref:tetratricopeptide repeat protein n=1 Tax=Psychrobacter sanguinis TaxID=861445 RepID=UPI0028AFE8EE|nr:tetratricopeptide repeat protein [Psychrobacter sanguinis]